MYKFYYVQIGICENLLRSAEYMFLNKISIKDQVYISNLKVTSDIVHQIPYVVLDKSVNSSSILPTG